VVNYDFCSFLFIIIIYVTGVFYFLYIVGFVCILFAVIIACWYSQRSKTKKCTGVKYDIDICKRNMNCCSQQLPRYPETTTSPSIHNTTDYENEDDEFVVAGN
jgi:hypothetical protein